MIRSWERRYRLVEPSRDASGLRLYSDKDIARLTLAGQATRLGHPIRLVAQLSDEQLEALVERGSPRAVGNEAVISRLLNAVKADDPAAASQVLRTAALLTPARELVLEILAPALREIGRQWERGDLTIWQEHFLSNQMLGIAATMQGGLRERPRIVLATPPFERHGFGIALAAMLATANGIGACNLDVGVPVAELVDAARKLRVVAVVIGISHEAVTLREAAEYVAEVSKRLSADVQLVVGGAAAEHVAEAVDSDRVQAVATLESFDVLCSQWR